MCFYFKSILTKMFYFLNIIKKKNTKTSQEIMSIKRSLIFNFGTITIPIRQWLYYILYPLKIENIETGVINDNTSLRGKAFSLLFMCILDALKEEKKIKKKLEILEQSGIICTESKALFQKTLQIYKSLLSKFTFEDQLFIRDRRLQNVHGFLSVYDSEKPKIPYFDKVSHKVKVKRLSQKKYRKVIKIYSHNPTGSINILAQRFCERDQENDIIGFLVENFRINQNYMNLLKKISEEINFKIEFVN